MDQVPMLKFLDQKNVERFVKSFKFGANPEIIQGPNERMIVVFRNGHHEVDGREVPLLRLQIEARRLIVDINGTSTEASDVFDVTVELLASISNESDPQFLVPIIRAEDTTIIAQLDFAIEKLFSPDLIDAVEAIIREYGRYDYATASAKPINVSFDIDYLKTDLTLDEKRLDLNRKQLVIGARKGFAATEQVYESLAPVNTDVHILLLKTLEETLS